MGLAGDIAHRDNPELAQKVNDQQTLLMAANDLHNELINSYHHLAAKIRTFDSLLMTLTVLQYSMVFSPGELESLPPLSTPKLEDNLNDRIQEVTLGLLGLGFVGKGLWAIGSRVANVFTEAAKVRGVTAAGGEAAEAGEVLAGGLDATAGATVLVDAGEVEMLTVDGADEFAEISAEFDTLIADLGTLVADLDQMADAVDGAAPATTEVGEAAASATQVGELASGATTATEGAAAGATISCASVLGGVMFVVIVVTSVIDVLDSDKKNAELHTAIGKMDGLIDLQVASLATLKKTFEALLRAGKRDIIAWNEIRRELATLEGRPAPVHEFSTDAFDTMVVRLDVIEIHKVSLSVDHPGISGFEDAVAGDIEDAETELRRQLEHDAPMTYAIARMKAHIADKDLDDLPDTDPFLQELADVMSVDLETVVTWNKFRVFLQTYADYLLPYHQQVHDDTPSGRTAPAKPKDPAFNTDPNPSYQPVPDAFRVP